jgi:hypothetical protein
MKVILALGMITLAFAAPPNDLAETFTVHNFTLGILDALKNSKEASPCYDNTLSLMDAFGEIGSDLDTLFGGKHIPINEIIKDLTAGYGSLTKVSSTCKYYEILFDILKFMEPGGMEKLHQIVLNHYAELTEDVSKMNNGNAYTMGFGLGDFVKVVTGFTI